MKWTYLETYNDMTSAVYDEFISEDGKLIKRVWGDGYTEIYPKADEN